MSAVGERHLTGNLFGRVYEVQIASGALALPDAKDDLKKAYRYGNLSGNNALHVQFTVEQQSEGTSKCHVTIANLAEAVRNNIRPRDAIRLYAGYPSNCGLLYYGYIDTHESKQSGPDVLTRVTCSGLETPPEVTDTRYTRGFVGAVKRSAILADIQKKCNLRISASGRSSVVQVARGVYSGIEDVAYPNGKALDGAPLTVLRQLFPPPFIVNVERGVITITDWTRPYRRVAVALNTKTGLIGTPGTTEHGTQTVYQFVSLMNVRLRAGAFVELQTSNAKEPVYCVVQTARFTGDSRSGPWFVECVASQVDISDPDASSAAITPSFMNSFSPAGESDEAGAEGEGVEE